MADHNHKKQEDGQGMSPVAAAVTGAVAGAVIGAGAVAGAIALKDEKNREKVKEVFVDVKDKAIGYAETALDKKDEIEQNLAKK